MFSNKLAAALLGVLGLAGAAGAGAFIATRQTAQPAAAMESVALPDAGPGGSGRPVEATEAVMDDAVLQSPDVEPVAPAPAPAKARAAKRATPKASASPSPRRQPAPRAERPTAPTARSSEPSEDAARVPADDGKAGASDRQARRSNPAEPADSWPRGDNTAGANRRAIEPVSPLPPPAPRFEELTVPADAVIGLRLNSGISSETAHVEDRVEARVTRDVRSDGMVVIPAGSRVLGSVSVVERGGKMKERARLGVRFHTLVLADGTEVALQTETVYREGESPSNASAAKVGGGAIGGAILGAILGGGKGAAIGAGVGAGAGTAAVMAGGRRPAQFQAGSPLTVKVLSPVTVTVEK